MAIANLPWLKDDDYQSAPVDLFGSIHMKNLISACKLSEISVFVSAQRFSVLQYYNTVKIYFIFF